MKAASVETDRREQGMLNGTRKSVARQLAGEEAIYLKVGGVDADRICVVVSMGMVSKLFKAKGFPLGYRAMWLARPLGPIPGRVRKVSERAQRARARQIVNFMLTYTKNDTRNCSHPVVDSGTESRENWVWG